MPYSLKEYDPEFCSKYGTGTEVENHLIDDAEDYEDYKFFVSQMFANQYIWVTAKPGYYSFDPSK